MLISTVLFTDGEERQFRAESVTVGAPQENLVRIELADGTEILIPLYSIKQITTEDLPVDAISPVIFNEHVPS
ncbi:MAG: hypothetical protein ACYC56_10440 [Candidatus Aquicultor sp.]